MRKTIIAALLTGAALTFSTSCTAFITDNDSPPPPPTIGFTDNVDASIVAPPSNCNKINWTELDNDGKPFIPVDVNNDGYIDCNSDLELGA